MSFYQPKPYKVEVITVTEENINNVFTWVSSSPVVNSHFISNSSFKFQYLNNPEQTVDIGSYVMKRANNAFQVIKTKQIEERWLLINEEDLHTVPTINQLLGNDNVEEWTRFSDIIFNENNGG